MIPFFLMQVLSDVTLQKARASASSPSFLGLYHSMAFHGIAIYMVGVDDTALLDALE